jgi:hypothetical protein
MQIMSRGQIVGPNNILAILPKRAFRVATWEDRRAPATQEATTKAVRKAKAFCASVAVNGRYMLFVYRTIDEHRACWRAITE